MKKRTLRLRLLCMGLSILLLSVCLGSCGKKDTPTVSEKTIVGTVDGRNVYYDELYYLVKNYLPSVKESTGGDTEKMQAELDRLIRENILVNFAILRLCENAGLTYDERDLKDDVQKQLDAMITNNFSGNQEEFEKSLAEDGLTERYLRYTLGIDLLYGDLLNVYPQMGLVSSDEAAIRDYIAKNFVHVYHLAIFNDTGDDATANYAKISEARNKLVLGETSMYQLIKQGYTEDFSDISGNGYYITRGTMNDAYEDAAFSLEINGVSEIVEDMGENNFGEYVSCYYVIQRFELDQSYINSHLSQLQDEYYSGVIYDDMNEIKASLSFTPNEYYNTLDLTALLLPDEGSNIGIIVLCILGGLILIIAIIIVTVLLVKKAKKKSSSLSTAKQHSSKNNSGGHHERS